MRDQTEPIDWEAVDRLDWQDVTISVGANDEDEDRIVALVMDQLASSENIEIDGPSFHAARGVARDGGGVVKIKYRVKKV